MTTLVRFARIWNQLPFVVMRLRRRTLLAAATAVPFVSRSAEMARIVCPLVAAPAVLVPGVSRTLEARLVGGKLYRGLCRLDPQGVPQPDLAARWDVSADALTYTFHLLPGLTWHDSGALTADDVVFSIDRFHRQLQPEMGLARVVSVLASDAHTVVVTLKEPFASFLHQMDALSAPIVPQHVHDFPGFALNPREVTPIGSGPFRMAEWLRLVRFDWFVGPKPSLIEIAFPILPDPAARLAMLEESAGLLVGPAIDPDMLAHLREAPTLVVEGGAPDSIAGLRLNHTSKPMDDPRVRLALASALDRTGILRDAWLGLGQVATGPGLASSPDRNPAATLPPFDARAASMHLTEAGLRPDDSGVRLRLAHLVRPGAVWQRLADTLRVRLQQVGVDLVSQSVTDAEWTRRVATGAFQTTGFTAEQTGDLRQDLAQYAPDQPGLAPLLAGSLAQAQALLVRDMPQIWLVEPALPVVRDRRLHLPGGVFDSFATASLS